MHGVYQRMYVTVTSTMSSYGAATGPEGGRGTVAATQHFCHDDKGGCRTAWGLSEGRNSSIEVDQRLEGQECSCCCVVSRTEEACATPLQPCGARDGGPADQLSYMA